MPSRNITLPIISGAILTVCAVFDYGWRSQVLVGLMLFLPLVDRQWMQHKIITPGINSPRVIVLGLLFLLLTLYPNYLNAALNTLLLAALPEEWFFRAYFMCRLEKTKIRKQKLSPDYANLITSALFTILHFPTQGYFGFSVFFPSLLYGWIFQKTRDLPLLIMIHTLSNIFFFIYLSGINFK